MGGAFMLFFALVAALFFYGLSQSRVQLTFFLVAVWIAVLFMSYLYPWIRENDMFSFVNADRGIIGGAGFLLLAFLLHFFFRRVFGRGHAETAAWWQVLGVALLEAGLIGSSLLTLFDFASFIHLSPLIGALLGSPSAFIVWLLLPLFGILLLAKRKRN